MTDTPTGPLLASEVLADQHYANFVGNSDTGFDAEGQVDALLACVPEGRDLVIRADGTMAELSASSSPDSGCFCSLSHRHGSGGGGCACCIAPIYRIVPLTTPSPLPAPEEEP